jgi:hypothetical protein
MLGTSLRFSVVSRLNLSCFRLNFNLRNMT